MYYINEKIKYRFTLVYLFLKKLYPSEGKHCKHLEILLQSIEYVTTKNYNYWLTSSGRHVNAR